MISVPETPLSDQQKDDIEKSDARNQALSEETSKIKNEMDDIRQQAAALKHGGSKEDYHALADKLQQLKADSAAAKSRFDSLGIPETQYSYGRVVNAGDWADLASHDARQAGDASGDNEDVRAISHENMQRNLDNVDSEMHGTS
jgi:hypothetical protein